MNFSYDTVARLLDVSLDKALAHRKYVLAGFAGVAVMIAAGIGFNWYWVAQQEVAQRELFDMLKYYDVPVHQGAKTITSGGTLQFGSADEKWSFIAQEFEKAYDRNKRAGIGPVFKLYTVDALIAKGSMDAAREAIQAVVAKVSSRELIDFLKLKLALMKIDDTQAGMQKDGLTELKAVADDSNNFANELGLYYLGEYYLAKNDLEHAKSYWQQLMVKYGMKDMKHQSGLAEQARSKLALISADW